ncbi:ComEA family DNA-binding protein [Micromonospora coxensis]|uniref:ComEA family DNA-binding protein n=1 Tax=Micromonospora coxensis TaxID=356852 RepID=UPI003427E22B
MSTAPDGSWQPFPPGPPSGAYGPGGPATLGPPPLTPSQANPAANWKWRLLHSWWLLLPILGCGCLGGFGFVYVGLRARRPAWWIAGIGYAVLGWTALFLADGDKDSVRGNVSAWLALATWVACVVHGLLINPAWLRWQAGYRPWYRQPQGWSGDGQPLAPPPVPSYTPWPPPPGSVGPGVPPASAPPSPAATWPPPAGVPAPAMPPGVSDPTTPPGVPPTMPLGGPAPTMPLGGPVPSAAAPTTPVTPVSGAPASGPPAGSTVDVNTATAAQLGVLPGFDAARVHRVLAERDARRAFGSVAEFVAAAGLAPHEYAPLRHVLVCAPPPSPPPGTGHGRVLDF